MKTHYLLLAGACSMMLGTTVSQGAVYSLSGTIDASQAGTNVEFGSGSSPGSGSITGNYNDVTNILDYSIAWTAD